MTLEVANRANVGQRLKLLGTEDATRPGFATLDGVGGAGGAVAGTGSSARQLVEPLGIPALSADITTNTTSAPSGGLAFASTCLRISIYQETAAARYRIGTGTVTAVATDHYIAAGERLDLMVPAGSKIAAIQDSAAGKMHITELA